MAVNRHLSRLSRPARRIVTETVTQKTKATCGLSRRHVCHCRGIYVTCARLHSYLFSDIRDSVTSQETLGLWLSLFASRNESRRDKSCRRRPVRCLTMRARPLDGIRALHAASEISAEHKAMLERAVG